VRNAARRNRRRADDDEDDERPAARRPWWWRILLRRPTDSVAVLIAVASATAIGVNAAYLQHGRHPAPMFALRPLPVAAAAASNIVSVVAHPRMPAPDERHEVAPAHPHSAPAVAAAPPANTAAHKDPIAQLLTTHPAQSQPQPSPPQPPAQVAVVPPARPVEPPGRLLTQPSRQVLAVQRALSEFGYGQLKPTGVYDAETKAAVQRFEREHSLPVTDEISEPMKRALATVTGRALD
jgi:hypothetical protein